MSFEMHLIFLAITKMLGDVAEKMGVGGEWLERMKLYWFWHLHLVHECTLYFPSAGFCTAELCILWFPWAACMGKKKVFKRKQSNKAINKHRKPWGTAEQLINSNNEGDCTNRKRTTDRISDINRKQWGSDSLMSKYWVKKNKKQKT